MKVKIAQKNLETGLITKFSIQGKRVGPFFIHDSSESEREWTVTHASTGYAVQRSLNSEARAKWLAVELSKLDVWAFSDPKSVKKIEKDTLSAIAFLRFDAINGDCQGQIDD